MQRVRQPRRCAWPGCNEKPKRKLGGMCKEHAAARSADALAAAYFDIADQLDVLCQLKKDEGWEGAPWPVPPGPAETSRMATDCRILGRRRIRTLQLDLPERRHAREIPMDPDTINDKLERSRQFIDEGLQELWPGRNSKAGITQEQWTTLRSVLELLSPKERRAYILVVGRGMKHRQAAREMKTSSGNVYNYLTRAQEKIAVWQVEQKAAQSPTIEGVEDGRAE